MPVRMLLASLLLLIPLTIDEIASSDNECFPNWFRCGNGRCVSQLWVCDGENECGDWTDEKDCGETNRQECMSSQFRCHDGKCIFNKWVCDWDKDCADGSDETTCGNSSCEGFRCPGNKCLPMRWKCDGEKDCDDGSDEAFCQQKTSICNADEFSCSSGSCLPLDKVCDGIKDCSDGSDEGDHCAESCSNISCSHGCKSSPTGPKCVCNSGYDLGSDNKTCSDINECLYDGFCSQKCRNNPGGYECSCMEGYKLENRSCSAIGDEPILVYSTLKEIKAMYLRSGVFFPVYNALVRCTALDVDPTQSRVYWTELSAQSAIYSVDIEGQSFQTILNNGVIMPEDIAVDYIARNLYLTDSGLKKVLVCKTDGSICATLHQSKVYKPRSLALDLPEGLMYWSDWGDKPKIERSGLDGSRRTELVSTDIAWPNGIVLDHSTNRLYWCDAKLNRIEYITLDGKVRKVILQEEEFHPYAVSYFEDKLYWNDWKTHSLKSCNKFTGHEQHTITKENNKRIMGVHVYHPVLAKQVKNPCWMNVCSHICVIASLGGHKCLCPSGFVLLSDQRTCIINTWAPQMFVTDKTNVYHMQPEGVGNGIITRLPISHLRNVADVSFNWMDKLLYISDTNRNIILEVNITSFRTRTLISLHLTGVDSLAYDWLGRNLYWADTAKGTVEVYSLATKTRSVLLSNLSRPIAIALVPERGVMFVSEVGSESPHVDMYQMNGQNKESLPFVFGATVALALHPTKPWLFWADQHTKTITSIDYLNPSKSKKTLQSEVPRVTSISVSQNFLYWMELSSHKVHLMPLHSDIDNSHHLTMPGNKSDIIIGKITYIEGSLKNKSSACNVNNGGCSHICLVSPTGHSCHCPEGMILSANLRTCAAKKVCSENEFKCVSSAVCFPEEFRCDGMVDCDDSSDERNCDSHAKCPKENFECRNGQCVSSSWKCDGTNDCEDHSDEEDCPKGCAANKFSCGDGQCVPDLWRCDRETDCKNGKDEEDCHQTQCKDNHIRCNNGQCIPSTWLCDDSSDCTDNSDESPERCGTSTPACLSDDFRCDNGVCIDHKFVCDRRHDCEDKSDEKGCMYNKTCEKDMFKCHDGTCIYPREICDGYADCDNDEHQNCSIVECSSTEFYCQSPKKCIPLRWLCDSHKDCDDGADENLNRCSKKIIENPIQESSVCQQFSCQSRQCISWHKVCDGVPDCDDYSDEEALCASSCKRYNGGCSHLCNPTPAGPRCTCFDGFKLSHDGKVCEDENECEIPGKCSQFCNNTKGGFKCFCADGYFLTQDNRKCKADGGAAILVYLLANQIRGFEIHTRTQRLYFEQDRNVMRAFDYDAEDGIFFWSDWGESTVIRYNIVSKRSTVLLRNLNRPYFIKWDWIVKNIYITTGEGSIVACSGNGEFCATVLQSGYRHISSLEIAPHKGVLFWSIWTDIRTTGLGLIERANMDGSGRIKLVFEKTYWPSSLTVDNVMERVYWTDVKTNVIESIDFHGLNRRLIVSKGISFPYSMTVFEDYVYWANWGSDQFIRANKFHPEDVSILHRGDIKSESIAIVHKAKQQGGNNKCHNSNCPQLCMPKPNGYSCLCDKKFKNLNGQCILTTRPPVAHDSPRLINTKDEVEKNKKTYTSTTSTEPNVRRRTAPSFDKHFSVTPITRVPCGDDSFCLNGGKCYMLDEDKRCQCPNNHFGFYCERGESEDIKYDYSWVVAVILSLASIGLIILVTLVCRQNRNKFSKFGDTLAVSFRNPRYAFRKRSGLVLDTDDPTGVDELMLGKKGAYTQSGFGNPVFNKQPFVDPSREDGEYKRWSSYDSEDSAFVSEQPNRDSDLNIEHNPFSNVASSSKDRIIQFFKRI